MGKDAQIFDSSCGQRFINPLVHKMYGTEAMGNTAGNLAERCNISREEQDQFAWKTQMKAAKAQRSGRLAQEIIPVVINAGETGKALFKEDEFIKPETRLENLATFKQLLKR